MASITKSKTGRLSVQFVLPNKKRGTISLDCADHGFALTAAKCIDDLISAMRLGEAPKPTTRDWIDKQWRTNRPLAEKMVAAGLIESRGSGQLGVFLAGYLEEHGKTAEPGTIKALKQAADKLIAYFGADRKLWTISRDDAKRWETWLRSPEARAKRKKGKPERGERGRRRRAKQEAAAGQPVEGLSEQTRNRRVGMAKQFFKSAIDANLIQENPFAKLKSRVHGNRDNQKFISRDLADRVIEAMPNAQWRLLFVLLRYVGLRCPTEPMAIRWSDVNFAANTITIRSKKTKRHKSGVRISPIWPEVLPYLEDARELAQPGEQFVITMGRTEANAPQKGLNANLRTSFRRFLGNAGIEPWPRIFQNLRATRATELAETPGIGPKKAAEFLGHSETIAEEHYHMAQQIDFHAIARFDTNARPIVRDLKALQNALHSGALSGDLRGSSTDAKSSNELHRSTVSAAELLTLPMGIGPEGLEPTTKGL